MKNLHQYKKYWFLLFFLCLLQISFAQETDDPKSMFDIVIDLDGVLIYPLSDAELKHAHVPPSPNRIIEFEGHFFRIADGAEEFITSLAKDPGVRLSIYSAASAARNNAVLKKIALPGGKTAFDLLNGRIFGSERLLYSRDYPIGVKDLRRILLPSSIPNAILIDDQEGIIPSQVENWLPLPSRRAECVEEILTLYKYEMEWGYPDYAVSRAQEFIADRNKLLRARGTIELAIRQARSVKISLREGLSRVKNANPTDVQLYRIGSRAFKAVNPKFHITPLVPRTEPPGSIRDNLRKLRN